VNPEFMASDDEKGGRSVGKIIFIGV